MTSGGKKDSTYIDDVFSTYLYEGNATAGDNVTKTIINGVDFTEGGLVWIKDRDTTYSNILYDTVRGTGTSKSLVSNDNSAEGNSSAYANLTSFNNNGFSIGPTSNINVLNSNTDEMSSWSFRKSKGFFDVVTWTGNNTGGRTIPHNLGCVPGCIMVKNTSSADEWAVWHRGAVESNATNTLTLNTTDSASTNNTYFDNGSTPPTKDNFTVHTSNRVNAVGDTYVAYVFAGGASTAATSRSVDFDGTGDYLSIADSEDFNYGSGDFTLELWVYPNIANHSYKLLHAHTSGGSEGPCNLYFDSSGTNMLTLYSSSNGGSFDVVSGTQFGICPKGQWTHIAVSREGNNIRMFRNGNNVATISYSGSLMNATGTFQIAARNGGNFINGEISNFRVVKGTAVYTSSFKPPTEPLTNITNTKLLCCNNSSVTGSTVTPGTITANGNPTASTHTPFDDPEGFKFGEEENQNIIKCGSYTGNGSSTGPEIYLGWEPQWVLVKNTTSGSSLWLMSDSMRGVVTGGDDPYLQANGSNAEYTTYNWIEFTPTGFKLTNTGTSLNGNGDTYIYMAIRRSDGYVGKPVEAGTDAFNVVYGNSSSIIPNFPSNFTVDMGIYKQPLTFYSWYTHTRLTGGKSLKTDSLDPQSSGSDADATFDANAGWGKFGYNTDKASWMWKRHVGFDVVAYGPGNSTAGFVVNHSLNKVPEMIWVKDRDYTGKNWTVYHKDLNGGTNPENYSLFFDTTAENGTYQMWNNTTPTSKFVELGSSSSVNKSGYKYLMMLFTSVDGISKLGSYTGNASSSGPTITLGFAPRFILIKCASVGGTNWLVYDTLRGLTSGNDKRLYLNTNAGQDTADDIDSSATGFQVVSTWDQLNDNNANYIYYAHA